MANEEKSFQIDDSNFYVVQGWMINKLGLSGNDLICFAIIYGFSQDGKSSFDGSLNYIAKFMACARRTVVNVTSRLEEAGLIHKESGNTGDHESNSYKTNVKYKDGEIIRIFPNNPPSEKNALGWCNNFPSPSAKIAPQYKDSNNYSYKDEKKDINSSDDSFISKEKPAKSNKEPQGIRPSKEEVETFIKERGYHITYQDMDDYYTDYGKYPFWMMISQKKAGKEPPFVKSWKGCCKTFEDNWKRRQGNQPTYRKIDGDDPWVQSMRELSEKAMKEQEKKYAKRRPTKAEHDLLIKQLYS